MDLNACYDLSCSPPSYDFVSFLLAAEGERLDRELDGIEFHILPGPADGFRRDGLPPGLEMRRQMLERVVLPMPRLLPSFVRTTMYRERIKPPHPRFGYGESHYGAMALVAAARRDLYPLRAATCGNDYITITLRESAYWPARNSNLPEWIAVAEQLRRGGERVVFVRDTDKADQSMEDFETDDFAAVDIHARASLYAGAGMNLFVNNGPAWLSWFMGAPTMVFKMLADAPCCNATFFDRVGLPVGSNLPNAKPGQHIVWADDTAPAILHALELECGF